VNRNHKLKILPKFFQAIYNRDKMFEIRRNDREFKVGDGIFFMEWDEEKQMYTGRQLGAEITYIINDSEYCKEGYVTFSFECGAASMNYSKEYLKVR